MVLSTGNTGMSYGILPVVELGVFIVGIAGGLRFDGSMGALCMVICHWQR
jgi:hypothetical protein